MRIRPAHIDLHFTEVAVEVRIGAVIRQRIARANLLVYAIKPLADVVAAFEELAASIARYAIEDVVLAIKALVPDVVKQAFAARSGGGYTVMGIARCRHPGKRRSRPRPRRQRRARAQAGGVYDIDRDVRAVSDVDYTLHLPVEDFRGDEAFRKQHQGLLAR